MFYRHDCKQANKKSYFFPLALISLAFLSLSIPEKGMAGHFLPSPLSSIIKISPPAPELYKDLVCTPQDKVYVGEIVIALSENSKWDLIWEEPRLSEIGAKIAHVHPLKFISTIFNNPALKARMQGIFDDYFKRNGFLGYRLIGGRPADGLGNSLTREADKNKLLQYLNDFAKEINVPVDNLRPFFEMRDWENLVRYLILS